eukprot:5276523-Amphidinium_carterae.1
MNLAEIEGELTKAEKVALAALDEAGVECVEEEDVDVEAAEEGVQDVDGDVVEVQDTGANAPPAKKRKKAIVPRAVQLFFLSFRDSMKQSRGMSSTEAWKVACELAPDVFAHIHKDSHRRWSYDTKPKAATKVTDIQITDLT